MMSITAVQNWTALLNGSMKQTDCQDLVSFKEPYIPSLLITRLKTPIMPISGHTKLVKHILMVRLFSIFTGLPCFLSFYDSLLRFSNNSAEPKIKKQKLIFFSYIFFFSFVPFFLLLLSVASYFFDVCRVFFLQRKGTNTIVYFCNPLKLLP